jgi:hypothetical protein
MSLSQIFLDLMKLPRSDDLIIAHEELQLMFKENSKWLTGRLT